MERLSRHSQWSKMNLEEMYPHLKRRLPLTVKEYLDSTYK